MPPLDFTPRLLPAPSAARYIGVSPSTLAKLPIPRRELGGKRLYDRMDLDAYADNLPYEAGSAMTCDEADAAWGS